MGQSQTKQVSGELERLLLELRRELVDSDMPIEQSQLVRVSERPSLNLKRGPGAVPLTTR